VSCTGRNETTAFKERVEIQVPPSDRLIHLALEMEELRGVGNWESGVQFAVEGSNNQQRQGIEAKADEDWVYSAGVRDPSILPIFDAAIQGFSGL
jgi:hypothetical protein